MSTTTDDTNTADALRAWARGGHNSEAAAELLIRAMRGRFASRGYPWIVPGGPAGAAIDAEQITDDTIGVYSGGEQRLLELVAALLIRRPIDLGDITAGVDRDTLDLILAAIAHAGGSHQHSGIITEDKDGVPTPVGFQQLTSLYTWPEPGDQR